MLATTNDNTSTASMCVNDVRTYSMQDYFFGKQLSVYDHCSNQQTPPSSPLLFSFSLSYRYQKT